MAHPLSTPVPVAESHPVPSAGSSPVSPTLPTLQASPDHDATASDKTGTSVAAGLPSVTTSPHALAASPPLAGQRRTAGVAYPLQSPGRPLAMGGPVAAMRHRGSLRVPLLPLERLITRQRLPSPPPPPPPPPPSPPAAAEAWISPRVLQPVPAVPPPPPQPPPPLTSSPTRPGRTPVMAKAVSSHAAATQLLAGCDLTAPMPSSPTASSASPPSALVPSAAAASGAVLKHDELPPAAGPTDPPANHTKTLLLADRPAVQPSSAPQVGIPIV